MLRVKLDPKLCSKKRKKKKTGESSPKLPGSLSVFVADNKKKASIMCRKVIRLKSIELRIDC